MSIASRRTTLLPALEDELEQLQRAPVAVLRKRWKHLFEGEPPRAFGPDLLRRCIAQKLQEKAYGALPKETERLLNKLVAMQAAQPDGHIKLPRRIKSGAILHRHWKGVSHSVTVVEDKYLYGGILYSNLSEIARLITGTRWNGPRFFGLRAKTAEGEQPEATGPSVVRTAARLQTADATDQLESTQEQILVHRDTGDPRDVPSKPDAAFSAKWRCRGVIRHQRP